MSDLGAEADIRRNLDDETLPVNFKPSTTPEEYIENGVARLRGLQRWLHDVEVSKIRKDHVIKVAKAMFDFHYQDMQHLLTLGMDVQKKKRFEQYMVATNDLQSSIQKKSGDAQRRVIENLIDQMVEADTTRNQKYKELESKVASGTLKPDQIAAHKRIHDKFFDALLVQLDTTADSMIDQHKKFLSSTLALFQEKLIEEGRK